MSPFERAICRLILSLPETWTDYDNDSYSHREELAVQRLIRGGFVEARVPVTVHIKGGTEPIETVWRVTGNYSPTLKSQLDEMVAVKGHKGKSYGVQIGEYFQLRLTSEGALARQDFRGEHEFREEGDPPGLPTDLFNLVAGGPDGSRGVIGIGVAKIDVKATQQRATMVAKAGESMPISKIPKAFMSYTWESEAHKKWVLDLATTLREHGVEVIFDQWHTAHGHQLPAFMEKSVRESDFVLIVCTPRYKQKSDDRVGGAGYEGHIMTAESLALRNDQKFIPILRTNAWPESAPSWLFGKYFADLRGDPYSADQFDDLVATLHGRRPQAPPVGSPPPPKPTASVVKSPPKPAPASPTKPPPAEHKPPTWEPVKILGIAIDEVTTPRNDGTAGSALYTVPFVLSRTPSNLWASLFVQAWDRPPQWTSMHRPGIARVSGDRIVLNGTTIEEVEKVHRDTLKVVLREVNKAEQELEAKHAAQQEQRRQIEQKHADDVRDAADRIKFDDFDEDETPKK